MSAWTIARLVLVALGLAVSLGLAVCWWGWRRGVELTVEQYLRAVLPMAVPGIVQVIAGTAAAWCSLALAVPAAWFGGTPLGIVNFLALQWLGVRLCGSYDPGEIPGRAPGPISDAEVAACGGRWWSRYAPPRGVRIQWQLLRWVWPLTGWWSPYRWIARPIDSRVGIAIRAVNEATAQIRKVNRKLLSSRRYRWFQRLIRVRRIHHPRWSLGWAFPLTSWCRFERMTYVDHDTEPPAPRVRAGHWKRCERDTYHDMTTTGIY